MKPEYMVIRVELRSDFAGKNPVRRKEAVFDLSMLSLMGELAPERVDQMAIMLARSMWDEAVLMGAGED